MGNGIPNVVPRRGVARRDGRGLRRAGVGVVATAATLLVSASPAAAHSTGGTGPTNYRTEVTALRPAVAGLSVRVLGFGARLELTNRTGAEVVVLGYQGEPYLRVGPDGVFANLRSPATYLNKDRYGRTPVPADARPDAAPRWQKLTDGRTARWHDHRVHWMGRGMPPVVAATPDRPHVLSHWEVPLRVDGRPVVVAGRFGWFPGPSPWPWLAAAAALGALAVVLVGRNTGLAVATLALVAVDVWHVAGIAWAPGEVGSAVARFVAAGVVPAVGWAAGVAAGWLLLHRRTEQGAALAAVAGFVALVLGGVGDLAALVRSQVPFAWGATAARAAVAGTLGLGVAVMARGGWVAWTMSAGSRRAERLAGVRAR